MASSRTLFWAVVAIAVLTLLPGALWYRWWSQKQLKESTLELAQTASDAAQKALTEQNVQGANQYFQQAEQYARAVLQLDPHCLEAALIASEAAWKLDRPEEALAYLEPFLQPGEGRQSEALAASAAILLELGRGREAEGRLRELLSQNPDHRFGLEKLVYLLTITGRRSEARAIREKLLRMDHFTADDLLFLGNPRALVEAPEQELFLRQDPDYLLPLLGIGQLRARANRLDEAEQMLRRVVEKYPGEMDAWGALGQVLLEKGDMAALQRWWKELPRERSPTPDIWTVLGMWAQQVGQTQAAARCFWEAARADANHQAAHYQLALSLTALQRPSEAEAIRVRAALLADLAAAVDKLFTTPQDVRTMAQAAELTERLGRFWEAWGWYRVLFLTQPNPLWAAARDRVQSLLRPELPMVHPDFHVAAKVDLRSFPLPRLDQPPPQAPQAPGPAVGTVRFRDVAEAAALQFQYFNADDPTTEGKRMFEFTGGGVVALDYDQDGWVDLYFPQGCRWPYDPAQQEYRDRLFRNLGNGRFLDVTDQAGLGDNRFSQGANAGDLNNDGFPDLMVGNLGENRLYLNNGDGTFREITGEAGISGERWTTSCLIADLNADGIPDLYEVNYLQGENVYDLICRHGARRRTCSPTEFDGQQDRLFLGLGDGRFRDITEQCGIVRPGGKGLGITALDLEGDGKLSIFVANDTTANFFFVNEAPPGEEPRFSERAVLAGLAFDRDGKPQACMGISVADVNGDQLLDLHVTNFFREHNTLYLQQPGGYFLDESVRWGLKETTFGWLGFGTEFLDADLDGRPDLVVANGHIDDFTWQGAPYRMPPQFFWNAGDRFVELPGPQLGPYFQQQLLGRGLARLDWNRDGLPDFAVSHLETPVALLENQTTPHGHYLTIHLRAVTTSRDAIGTTVRLTTGSQSQLQQLVAGDGYESCNQRSLMFGLGPHRQVDVLTVRWPSGQEQTFRAVMADREILVVEGREELVEIPGPQERRPGGTAMP